MNPLIKVYFVVIPGLENLALLEIYEWLGIWNRFSQVEPVSIVPQISNGGIEVTIQEDLTQFFERTLKIPTRILQRVESFECRSMDTLKDWIKKFKSTPLSTGVKYEVNVFSRSSELFHKKNIEDIAERLLNKGSFAASAKGPAAGSAAESQPQRIDFRFFRDECTVSLDRSGQSLYKRGYKKNVGEAPLRENMASAFIRQTMKGIPRDSWEDYEFVDAMCGSGTFSLEAFFIGKVLESRRQCFESVDQLVEKFQAIGHAPGTQFASYLLNDRSEVQLAQAKKNIEGLLVNYKTTQTDLAKPNRSDSKVKSVVLVNPPYGQRLKRDQIEFHLRSILENVVAHYGPERIGIVYPDELRNWPVPEGYQQVEFVRLEHGGLPVRFMTFARDSVFSSTWLS